MWKQCPTTHMWNVFLLIIPVFPYIYIICKCLSCDEEHCKPIIGTYTIHATNKSKEKYWRKVRERKINWIDLHLWMQMDRCLGYAFVLVVIRLVFPDKNVHIIHIST